MTSLVSYLIKISLKSNMVIAYVGRYNVKTYSVGFEQQTKSIGIMHLQG